MSKIFVELSMSLDGFVAGPNDGPENGLGDGGDQLARPHLQVERDLLADLGVDRRPPPHAVEHGFHVKAR